MLHRPTSFPRLRELADIVAIGTVKSVKPPGLETKLGYPTLTEFVFQWLRVEMVISASLKGAASEHLDVAMLDVKTNPMTNDSSTAYMANGPGLIHPKTGDSYLMFLAKTSAVDLYASVLAPFHERSAVFTLDREQRGVVELEPNRGELEELGGFPSELREMYQMLVNSDGHMLPHGIQQFREQYSRHLEVVSDGCAIPLEWNMQMNDDGWSRDVPKADS